ncbi:MAG: hypothetical protein ACLRNW_21955 [Neglectibacter sp.]
MKKLYGIKSPVSQHPKKHLLSCCGSSPTSNEVPDEDGIREIMDLEERG